MSLYMDNIKFIIFLKIDAKIASVFTGERAITWVFPV